MENLLKFCDFFGEPIKLFFNKKSAISTNFGGILTILTIISVIIFSWLIGNDIYFKEKPFYYQQNQNYKDFQEVLINRTSFPTAIGIFDDNGTIIEYDERYFNLSASYIQLKVNEEGSMEMTNKRILELESCAYKHFASIEKKDFDKMGINNMLCLKTDNFQLNGYWSETELTYLSFGISLCNFDKTRELCATEGEIWGFINEKSVNFGLFVINHQVTVNNFTDPISYYFESPYKYIAGVSKSSFMMVQKDVVLTDTGFFFEDVKNVSFLKAVEYATDIRDFDPISKQMILYEFYASDKSSISFRKYIKIPEILASVGGILKIFNLVCDYLNLPLSRIALHVETIQMLFRISNNSYHFKPLTILTCKEDSLKISKCLFTKRPRFFSVSPSPIRMQGFHEPTKNVKLSPNLLMRQRSSCEIALSFGEKIIILCRKIYKNKDSSNPNVNIYEKGLNEIQSYFDLTTIFKKIQEVDNLKTLFLEDYQIQLFNLLKRKLDLNISKSEAKKEYLSDNALLEKLEEGSEMDKKLVELLF